jgi:hypothetical protein
MSKPKPDSFRALIDETFGGAELFARAVGIEKSHVEVMRHRGSIAPEHWPAIVGASRDLKLGVSFDDLAELRVNRRTGLRKDGATPPEARP